MSDSDDTDVLLLIPPDLFVIASDSDDNSDSLDHQKTKSGVVTELIDHMQSLESRISAIEANSPNNSLNLSRRLSLDSIMSSRQTLPRTKFSVSQNLSLQKTPTKHSQCLSLPSTPSIQQLHHTNETHHTFKSHRNLQNNVSNSSTWSKHDNSKLFSEPASMQNALQNKSFLHVGSGSSDKDSCSLLHSALNVCESNVPSKLCNSLPFLNSSSVLAGGFSANSKPVLDMSLSEVDEFIKEIERTDKDLPTRNHYSNDQILEGNLKESPSKRIYSHEKGDCNRRKTMDQQKQKYNVNSYNPSHETMYQSDYEKRRDLSDFTLPNDTSFSSFDTEKFMSEFKPWTPSLHEFSSSKFSLTEPKNFDETEKCNDVTHRDVNHINETDVQNFLPNNADNQSANLDNQLKDIHHYLDEDLLAKFADEITKSQTISSATQGPAKDNILESSKSCPSIFKMPNNVPCSKSADTLTKNTEFSNHATNGSNSVETNPTHVVNSSEVHNQRPQRLLTLSDFWSNDSKKSRDEHLRIKLEEERFRREHCEELIQELQKKLLEQQEKLAVAIRVDNEKNAFITQFQGTWKKMKQKLSELESERENLQKLIKNISEKNQLKIADCQEQIKNYKEELSKALNLATGYKEKSDCLVRERVDLLKSHADELQGYKSLVQQAESRYEEMKVECQKLLEKNQQTDEALKTVQQELNKELLRGGEVRTEMTAIHKALDTCETELTILRQEKENLQLKLKEELNRNSILEDTKASLVKVLEEAKKNEKLSKQEVQLFTEQQEKLRAELRDVYQKQVDEVVKAKLQEFQTQLDSAEMLFQNEIETKQRAIAECAAKKIKSVIDKHQLEVNLVEEKHKEEKRLFEIKLAQAMQKSAMLEAQLNSYRKSKNQLVEQLHCMMQKQWQQALLIISGGNNESLASFQKLSVEKLFEFPHDANLELVPNHCSTLQYPENMKVEPQKSTTLQNAQMQERQNDSLITLTSHEETPLTSRKESKHDLKKYIKMILEMQQSKEMSGKPKFFNDSPPSSQKEQSSKQSLNKDINTSNEGSSTWQPVSEISMHDTSEYLSVPQKFSIKNDQYKQKPPWK